MSEKLLSVSGLNVEFVNKRHHVNVIDGISFDISAGETVCLVGESGSGKSVTAKTVMRLIEHEGGRIAGGNLVFNGDDLAQYKEKAVRSIRGDRIAMVFQEPMAAFDPVFTIGKQITECIRRHTKQTVAQANAKAVDLLRRVGISEPEARMKQYPNELSGGMLQRAMIAMALSCEPDILIADEPTTALDVTIQAQILNLLRELKREFNMAVLLITHDLGIAAEMADRVCVMYAGRIVENSATEAILRRPLHPYTQGLLRSVTALNHDKNEKLYSISGTIPALTEMPEGCRFNPRCPFATDKCREAEPPLETRALGSVACWRTGEVNVSSLPVKGVDAAQEREESAEKLFEVRNVSRHYVARGFGGAKNVTRAVDDVSFDIIKGETFGLVGESGSGKSTLGRLLLRLEKVTSGEIRFDGRDITNLKSGELRDTRRHMQAIFQDPYGSMDPRWRVGKIVEEPLRAYEKLENSKIRGRAAELLELVGLDRAAYEKFPHEFSGGQRQRICIARAVALSSKFILADEAVSALDVSVQAQIVNLLRELQEKLGLTYLFIAHSLSVVRHVSDRIGVMYLGQLVEIAPATELFSHPAHPYTRGLIASVPSVDNAFAGETRRELTPLSGEIPSPMRPPSGCRFHPRCPSATARCSEESPTLRQCGSGHLAACHNIS
ncbi:MAG: ABC transporter ATP-binding protein [Oscillospiraceae bacterium]|nr:ABC transporter ATP-binding protein [Oscillospiraceae bacterium]